MKFSLPGILFLLTLISGFWLSNTGQPYNGMRFNIHKLIALGAVVVTVIEFSKMVQVANSPVLTIILLIATALCVIVLFTSGALMSIGKPDYFLLLTIHRIAPVGLTIAVALVIYLLSGQLGGHADPGLR
ncbi:MAG: hypothetical protein FJ009_12520 [Chloroflexi bacterium]|nr:hypothetical protein [Chloroflexota bacterium]